MPLPLPPPPPRIFYPSRGFGACPSGDGCNARASLPLPLALGPRCWSGAERPSSLCPGPCQVPLVPGGLVQKSMPSVRGCRMVIGMMPVCGEGRGGGGVFGRRKRSSWEAGLTASLLPLGWARGRRHSSCRSLLTTLPAGGDWGQRSQMSCLGPQHMAPRRLPRLPATSLLPTYFLLPFPQNSLFSPAPHPRLRQHLPLYTPCPTESTGQQFTFQCHLLTPCLRQRAALDRSALLPPDPAWPLVAPSVCRKLSTSAPSQAP